jgi:hypothetical protein
MDTYLTERITKEFVTFALDILTDAFEHGIGVEIFVLIFAFAFLCLTATLLYT